MKKEQETLIDFNQVVSETKSFQNDDSSNTSILDNIIMATKALVMLSSFFFILYFLTMNEAHHKNPLNPYFSTIPESVQQQKISLNFPFSTASKHLDMNLYTSVLDNKIYNSTMKDSPSISSQIAQVKTRDHDGTYYNKSYLSIHVTISQDQLNYNKNIIRAMNDAQSMLLQDVGHNELSNENLFKVAEVLTETYKGIINNSPPVNK